MRLWKIIKLSLLFIPFLICKVFYRIASGIMIKFEDKKANPLTEFYRCPKCGYYRATDVFVPYTNCPICTTFMARYNRKYGAKK